MIILEALLAAALIIWLISGAVQVVIGVVQIVGGAIATLVMVVFYLATFPVEIAVRIIRRLRRRSGKNRKSKS